MANNVEHPPYVTTTTGMRGYFAVLMCWSEYPEEGIAGFYEPYNTGITCKDHETAVASAKAWAEAEEIEYRP